MLGFGLGYEEEWHLMWDGRICHRMAVASALKGDDGKRGFSEGNANWTEEVMPFDAAPPDVQQAFRARRDEILGPQHERPALPGPATRRKRGKG